MPNYPEGYFSGGAHLTDNDGLRQLINGSVDATIASLHFYVNGTTGDDTFDGLTAATAKKSLQAAFDLIPFFVRHNVLIDVAGEFLTSQTIIASKYVEYSKYIVINGDPTLYKLYDNVGSPWVATGATTGTVTFTGAGWTNDSLAGYILEITSDSPTCPTQNRLIVGNTSDTITVVREWASAPTACKFRICRPVVKFTSGSCTLTNVGPGNIFVQNLYVNGNFTFYPQKSVGTFYFSHVIMDPTSTYTLQTGLNSGTVALVPYRINTSTFATEGIQSYSMVGFSHRGLLGLTYFVVSPCYISGSFIANLRLRGCCTSISIGSGSRIGFAQFYDCVYTGASNAISSTTGYPVTKFGNITGQNYNQACMFFNSGLQIAKAEFSGANSGGIYAMNSKLDINTDAQGPLFGNNGQYGVTLQGGSIFWVWSGALPLLTGPVGQGKDFEISTGGVITYGTWANLFIVNYIQSPDTLSLFTR